MLENIFSKKSIPESIPESMQIIVQKLDKTGSRMECLKLAYDILSEKYYGGRVNTYIKVYLLFDQDVNTLWKRKGFLHCNSISYILRILLVKSRWFEDDDMELRWTFMWFFSPHQHMVVRVGDDFVNIDIWAKRYGVKFGDYARGFR